MSFIICILIPIATFVFKAFTYHNVTINKALTKSFHGKLKVFLDMKLLSNEGRAKTVVSLYAMNEMIKHTTAIITIHDSVPYVVQSITACLLMFYTGVRPGSLVPTTASLASTWGYLTWGVRWNDINGIYDMERVNTDNISYLGCGAVPVW